MPKREMECRLPNGDTLSAWYDGGKLRVMVRTSGAKQRAVFDRSYTNGDLTGDPMFDRPADRDPSDEVFIAQPAFFGPDE